MNKSGKRWMTIPFPCKLYDRMEKVMDISLVDTKQEFIEHAIDEAVRRLEMDGEGGGKEDDES